MIQAIQLLLSLTILVVAHEFGHFFFSKIFGVRVEKFYMFFNPSFSIFKAKKIQNKWHFKFFAKNDSDRDKWKESPENTEWGIGWLPLGGYCKIAGMIDESMDREQMKKPAQPWEYRSASVWKRLPIISGGVLVNFFLALFIYAMVLWCWGKEFIDIPSFKNGYEFSQTAQKFGFKNGDILLRADGQMLGEYDDINLRKIINAKEVTVIRNQKETVIKLPQNFGQDILFSKEPFASPILPFVINEVVENSPAKKAGISNGDSIGAINGKGITSFFTASQLIKENANKTIQIELWENNISKTIQIKPDSNGLIGVRPYGYAYFFEPKKIEFSFWESIPNGATLGWNKLTGYISDFKYVFTKEGVESLGGFASIGKLYDEEWNWKHFWEMTAFLSIILAFMNFLPIPGLDGGHFLFLLYEMITQKKPSQKFLEYAQTIGMIFLIWLMIYANLNDFL